MTGVLVVGSVNVDLVATVDRLPAPGETVVGGNLDEAGGGKGANAAVAAARLGARVWLVAAVGADERGKRERASLAAEGVDVEHVATLATGATGVALIIVDSAGENQIAVASGANSGLTAEHVVEAFDAHRGDLGVVLVGFEIPMEPVAAAVRMAAEHRIPCVVNPAPAHPGALDLAGWGPLLTPNAAEARQLTGLAEPVAAAAELAGRTGAPAIVTLGADGAVVAEPGRGRARRVSAHPVPVRDTTGAGDTFNAALGVRLGRSDDLEVAVDYAVAAAALAVGGTGARSAMPDDAAVRAALRTAPPA
jgi:ribokinase